MTALEFNGTGITRRSLHLVLLIVALMPAVALAIDFKGIELGQPLWLTTERSVFGKLDCNPMHLNPVEYHEYVQEMQGIVPGLSKVCTGSTSIATVPAEATVLLGTSRRVLRLTFQFAGENYARIAHAMTQKWGEGAVASDGVHDETVWWDFADGSSIFMQRTLVSDESGSLESSTVVGLVEYSLPVATPAGDL